jgi:hypothetical protein
VLALNCAAIPTGLLEAEHAQAAEPGDELPGNRTCVAPPA